MVTTVSRQLTMAGGFWKKKQSEQIELLELNQSGIHVAEYLTALPSKEALRDRLHKAIEHARQRFEINQNELVSNPTCLPILP